MRILKLRFCNLNSLHGEWSVDFEHPDYLADGIFAITGPTGAGKSTILDAICLALYGQTPRLGKITKSQNEIMSRQAGECFAEVTFQTQAGTYCCHWSQIRARKQAHGNLQNPMHEISEPGTQKVLATKLRDVGGLIQEITGMDFDQFTRSMLLAQGSFAAFLKASADERSPILEQITGTQIYSAISFEVHKRNSLEAKAYDELKAAQANLDLMEPDEEEQVRADAKALRTEIDQISLADQQHQALIQQLSRLKDLAAELVELKSQREDWEIRQTQFSPQRERLQQAQAAQTLALEYSKLTDARQSSHESSKKLNLHQASEEPLNAAHDQQKQAHDQAVSTLSQSQAQLIEQQPLIEQAKLLDQQIADAALALQEIQEQDRLATESFESLKQQSAQNQAEQSESEQALAAVSLEIENHPHYQNLSEQLPMIQKTVADCQRQQERAREQTKAYTTAQVQSETCKTKLETQQSRLTEAQAKRDQSQDALQGCEGTLADLLQDKSPADYQQALDSQKDLLQELKEAIGTKQVINRSEQSLTDAQASIAQYEQELNTSRTEAQANAHQVATLSERISACQREMELQKQILRLEDERARLIAGEPCPLCGAKEHPYGHDSPVLDSKLESQLKNLQTELASLQSTQTQNTIRQTELAKEIERSGKAQTEAEAERASALALFVSQLERLKIDQDANLEVLQTNFSEREHRLTEDQRHLKNIREMQDQLQGHNHTLNQQQAQFQEVQSQTQTIQTEFQKAAYAAEQLAQVQSESQAIFQANQAELEALLRSYHLNGMTEDLERLLHALKSEETRWKSWLSERESLSRQGAVLAERARNFSDNLALAQKKCAQSQLKLAEAQKKHQDLSQKRTDCFGAADPVQTLNDLQAACEKAQQDLSKQAEDLQNCQQALSKYQLIFSNLKETLSQNQETQNRLEKAFHEKLTPLKFTTEADYLQACLSSEAVQQIEAEQAALKDQETELKARAKQIENQRQHVMTQIQGDHVGQDLEALIEQQKSREEQSESLAVQLGTILQRLDHNDKRKAQSLLEVEKMQAQSIEVNRWQALHNLIGSSTGKKFRNFAQGLTFDVMIYYANQQLQKMSRRYLLKRESTDSLDLSILDSFQGGEIRSTKNLSGGESFIVSLALALGLSQMASQNVRVDSLFLDEGFGTLDQEALDTALETLAGLQQENKLIGIISHVQALKERMGTQIKVRSYNNGTSRLSGPGVAET